MSEPLTGTPHPGGWLWSVNALSLLLWPVSLMFCALVRVRRRLYVAGLLKSTRLARPVIVVGNISVGGNGKTPVVYRLFQLLQEHGYKAGILTRGYRGDTGSEVVILQQGENSAMAGDEANMLSELCTCPVAVAVDRARAGRELLKRFPGLDLLISDDGLQHYALARDIEIIVKREAALGNGFCLPAGPLREPPGRLDQCDLLIDRDAPALSEHLGDCWNLMHPRQSRPLASFARQNPHALAGIAFPGTFFEALRRHGLQIEARAFPDHHDFRRDDLPDDGRPILVTHKDAVKLRAFAMENIWVVPLELQLPDDLQYRLLKIVESSLNG